MRKAALASILAIVLGGGAGLATVDLWVGWLDRHQGADDAGLLLQSRAFGWVNRPGFRSERIRINALGLRNDEVPADAPPTEVRIVCLGDSRIHGSGVADAEVFTEVLQQRLTGVRVLNGGVNSYTLLQCAQRALDLLPQTEPDLVLLFASPGWTLRPNVRVGDWLAVGDRLIPGDVLDGWPELLHPWAASWHELLQASNLYARHRTAARRGADQDDSARHFVLSRAPPPESVVPFLDGTRDALRLLGAEAEARGIEVRVVLLPETFQIAPHIWRKYLLEHAATGAPPIGTSAVEPMAALQELVGSADLRAWTLYQEILAFMSDVDRYYQADEAHWNPSGHAAMAETLEWLLREEGLLAELALRRERKPR